MEDDVKFAMLISDASRRVDPLERFDGLLRQIEESLEIMKLCWAMEDFDFNGRHWQIEGATPSHRMCAGAASADLDRRPLAR
jgi:alkanesulfonate monooxygenase SsuD/methylene tetrahydromethanopterin reductase-like flavin-dependent oxidoreductase (luciferase family)